MQLEHLFQPLHVVFAFLEMSLEALLELRIVGFRDHLRQCLHDLLFSVIHVAQRMDEQVIHVFDIFREEAHSR